MMKAVYIALFIVSFMLAWGADVDAGQHPAPADPAELELYAGTGINHSDGEQMLVKVRPFKNRNIEIGLHWYRDTAKEPTVTFVDGEKCLRRYDKRNCVAFEQIPVIDFDTVSNQAYLVGYRWSFLNYYAASAGAAWIENNTDELDENLGAYVGVSAYTPPFTKYCVRASAALNHVSSVDDDKGVDGVFLGVQVPIGGCAK